MTNDRLGGGCEGEHGRRAEMRATLRLAIISRDRNSARIITSRAPQAPTTPPPGRTCWVIPSAPEETPGWRTTGAGSALIVDYV
jgi:hypothetical protein